MLQKIESRGWDDLNVFDLFNEDTGMSADEYAKQKAPSWSAPTDQGWGGTSSWFDDDNDDGKVYDYDGPVQVTYLDNDGDLISQETQTIDKATGKITKKTTKKGSKKKKAAAIVTPEPTPKPAYMQLATPKKAFPWLLVAGAGAAIYFLLIRRP